MVRTRQHEGPLRTKHCHRGVQGDGTYIKLPKPGWTRGLPLFKALKLRRSIREVLRSGFTAINAVQSVVGRFRRESARRTIRPPRQDRRVREQPGLKDTEVQRSYYYVDTGLIAANVYIFAASTGLAAWFHNRDKDALPPSYPRQKNTNAV